MSELPAPDGADEVVEEGQVLASLPAHPPMGGHDPHALGIELPDHPEEAIELLLAELSVARGEATTYLDDLRRVAADFDNYRKRSMREQGTMLDRATEKVVSGLLPVLDTFDAALNTDPATDGERQIHSGMINTRTQLIKALEAEGLEVIPTVGERFSPEIHEPAGAPVGEGELVIAKELRRGYLLNGRVLRAALVVLEVRT